MEDFSHLIQLLYLLVYTESAAGFIFIIRMRPRSNIDRHLNLLAAGTVVCGFFLAIQVFLEAVGFIEILQEVQQSRITLSLNSIALGAIGLVWISAARASIAFISQGKQTGSAGSAKSAIPRMSVLLLSLVIVTVLGTILLQWIILFRHNPDLMIYLTILQTCGAILFLFTLIAAVFSLIYSTMKAKQKIEQSGLFPFIMLLVSAVVFTVLVFLGGGFFGIIAVPSAFLILDTLGLITIYIRSRGGMIKPAKDMEAACRSLGLTKRETEVAILLSRGYAYKEIGEKLFISMATIQTHIGRIYTKLGVNNKTKLANRLNRLVD